MNLATQSTYAFTVSSTTAPTIGRFELVFSPLVALATAPAALAQQVALYPNLATGSARVELPAALGRETATATLVDALGHPVRAATLPTQDTAAHTLDLYGLPSGVYLLRLSSSAGTLVRKLTVE